MSTRAQSISCEDPCAYQGSQIYEYPTHGKLITYISFELEYCYVYYYVSIDPLKSMFKSSVTIVYKTMYWCSY